MAGIVSLIKNIRSSSFHQEETKLKNKGLVECCEELFELLAAETNPDDGVLELLNQMEEADSVKFGIILKSLKTILSRNIEGKKKLLEWTLNSIRSHTEQFSYNNNNDEMDSEDETGHFYNDVKINEIEVVMNLIIFFYEPFVQEAFKSKDTFLQNLICSRLLQMFDIFLPYINVKSVPQLKAIEWKLQNLILQLLSNPMILLQFVFLRSLNIMKSRPTKSLEKKKTSLDDYMKDIEYFNNSLENVNVFEDITIVSNMAYGMFFFSLLNESENENIKVPLVYNPKYIMLSLIYVTIPFFEKKTNITISHGLKFLNLLLKQLNEPLEKADLYFSTHKSILTHLNNIMIYCQVEESRKLALICLKKYIECFNWEARYLLLFNFRAHVNHSGTLGFLISLLKEFVSTFLELPQNSQAYHKFIKYYRGKLLFDIIRKYCFLKNDKDLVGNGDHVISSLNALRFLVIRDKDNVTDVKHFIKKIIRDFLNPLKEEIKVSRSYYKSKLKEIENKNNSCKLGNATTDIDLELSLKGQPLPKLTEDQEKAAYHSCLNCLDLIDSLHIRLMECLFTLNRIQFCSSKSVEPQETNSRKDYDSSDHQYENNIKEKILNASLQFVPTHGWSKNAIINGAESIGYPGITNGIFPNGGADLINYFYAECNKKLKNYMEDKTANVEKALEPKDFILNSIETRLRMIIPYIEKWPQAIAIMSLPHNVPIALANLLTLVDDICYYAGDKSVDFGWYTRRVGVGGIYKTTELYMIQDKSVDYHETWKFLNRRLTEAIQIQQMLNSSSEATTVAKDVISAAFTTARNILRINYPR